MNELSPRQLRITLDYLYDGEMRTFKHLQYIQHNFKRAHHIFLWLVRNKIRGVKLVEFFENESGDIDGGGLLSGVARILSGIDGVQYKTLNACELK